MSKPYLGETTLFAFSQAVEGWLPCEGQILNIKDYQALFSLLGRPYGGDASGPSRRQTVVACPVSVDPRQPGYAEIGRVTGAKVVTLTVPQMPSHTHAFNAAARPGDQTSLVGAAPAQAPDKVLIYGPPSTPAVTISETSMHAFGGGQA